MTQPLDNLNKVPTEEELQEFLKRDPNFFKGVGGTFKVQTDSDSYWKNLADLTKMHDSLEDKTINLNIYKKEEDTLNKIVSGIKTDIPFSQNAETLKNIKQLRESDFENNKVKKQNKIK